MERKRCREEATIIAFVPWDIPLLSVVDLLKGCKARIISLNEESRRIVASLPIKEKCISILRDLLRDGIKFRVEVSAYCRTGGGRLSFGCLSEKLGMVKLERKARGARAYAVWSNRILVVEDIWGGFSVRVGRVASHLPPLLTPSDLEVPLDSVPSAVELVRSVIPIVRECIGKRETRMGEVMQ